MLNCSKLRQMGDADIYLLLSCLEEALERNGDVRLAANPKEASATFDRSALGGLLELLDTTSSVTETFRWVPKNGTPPRVVPCS